MTVDMVVVVVVVAVVRGDLIPSTRLFGAQSWWRGNKFSKTDRFSDCCKEGSDYI